MRTHRSTLVTLAAVATAVIAAIITLWPAAVAGAAAVFEGRIEVGVPVEVHCMIMPARGDRAGAVGSLPWPCPIPTRTSTRSPPPWTGRECPRTWRA